MEEDYPHVAGRLRIPVLHVGHMPWLSHLVASLLKGWPIGKYQGATEPTHLEYYLDAFTFRLNRGTSKSRDKLFYGFVQQGLLVDPVPNKELNPPDPGGEDENLSDLETLDDHNI